MRRTVAQMASVVKAREAKLAKRTCQRCKFVAPAPRKWKWVEKIEGGWCSDCWRKAGVEEWAATLFSQEFLVVDSETTALWPEGEVIELALVHSNGAVLLNSLIKPQGLISSEARKIHHISDEELAGAPAFPEVWPTIASLLRRYRVFVGYNSAFDLGVLEETARRYGLRIPGLAVRGLGHGVRHRYHNRLYSNCVMEKYAIWHGAYSRYHMSYTWQSLERACRTLEVERPTHRALDDAKAALGVLQKLAAFHRGFACPAESAQLVSVASRSHKKSVPIGPEPNVDDDDMFP